MPKNTYTRRKNGERINAIQITDINSVPDWVVTAMESGDLIWDDSNGIAKIFVNATTQYGKSERKGALAHRSYVIEDENGRLDLMSDMEFHELYY